MENNDERSYFNSPFRCRETKDFSQDEKGRLKVDLLTLLSVNLKEPDSTRKKREMNRAHSTFLSAQQRTEHSDGRKDRLNIQLSVPLSDALKAVISFVSKSGGESGTFPCTLGCTSGCTCGCSLRSTLGCTSSGPWKDRTGSWQLPFQEYKTDIQLDVQVCYNGVVNVPQPWGCGDHVSTSELAVNHKRRENSPCEIVFSEAPLDASYDAVEPPNPPNFAKRKEFAVPNEAPGANELGARRAAHNELEVSDFF